MTRVRLGGWQPPKDGPFANQFPQVFYCTNPGGPSHLWLKENFVDCLVPYTSYDGPSEHSLRRMFIPSLAIDNRVLLETDPGYLQRLKDIDDPVKRKMYLWGK